MISVTRLLCNSIGPGDYLRYETKDTPRPVVVWNCTRQCNLSCIHCYASSDNSRSEDEMDTKEAKAFISDLAEFGVPVILFSGGEPMLRKDLLQMAALAHEYGIITGLSTNGTLITDEMAKKLSRAGFGEVGISLDGIGGNNDYFRGKQGAFQAALSGIRRCIAMGIRVSLRLTISRHNYQDIPAMFRLIDEEWIERFCLYHLAYAGRGSALQKEDIDHSQTRQVMDTIIHHTLDLYRRSLRKEILTVGSHSDGVYLYLKLKNSNPERAEEVKKLLKVNGGNNSGIRISSVDDRGNVHPDQFWWHYSLGNVRQRNFGDIWTDTSDPLLKGLKDRKKLLKGRCARCQYLDMCNGNLRVRAEAVYGDVWAQDPACYLTDEEIGLV
jgi:radical SAM protein with 4Fe4S-binding SPASM domain